MVLLNVYPTTTWNEFLQVMKPKSGHISVNPDAAYKQIQPRDQHHSCAVGKHCCECVCTLHQSGSLEKYQGLWFSKNKSIKK